MERLLIDTTLYEMKNNHLDAANRHLCDLVKLVACQHPEPLVICQLIRQGCAASAFEATWQALQAPGWNDSQLAALQSAWEGFDFPKDMEVAMEMERAMTFDLYDQIKGSKSKLALYANQREAADEVLGGITGSLLPTHGFVFRWVHLPFWRLAWADQEELFALNKWNLPIQRERIARTNCCGGASRPVQFRR